MSVESNAPAAVSPALSRNVVPLRPRPAPAGGAPEPASPYRVRVGSKIFQGRDLKTLLKLAVQARVKQPSRL